MDFKEKRTLGRTGLRISRLGLSAGYGISQAGVEKAYHEYGINYFYWGTLRRSGMKDALRNIAAKNREDIVILLQSYDHLGFTLTRSVKKGIKALAIDYIDIILLGWFNKYPSKKVISEARKLKESGLVKHIGLSGHNRKFFGTLAQKQDSPFDIFMIRYNAAHRGAENEIFPFLPESNRPGITTYTATRWGKLLNPKKMPPGEAPLTAADCYRFALTNPNVDLCIMGPKTEKEMNEGLLSLEKGPLSDEEMARARIIGDHVHG